MLSSSSLSLRDQMFWKVRSLLRFFKDQLASSHINNSATSSALAGPDGDMCLILLSICRSTWLIYLFMSSSLAAINIEEFFGFHVILLCHVSSILKPKLGRWVWFKRNLQEIPIHGWILQTCVFRLYFFFYLCFSTLCFTAWVSLCRGLDLYFRWPRITHTTIFLAVVSIFPEHPENRLVCDLTVLPVWQVGPQGTWQSFGYCRIITIWIR